MSFPAQIAANGILKKSSVAGQRFSSWQFRKQEIQILYLRFRNFQLKKDLSCRQFPLI